VLAFLLGGATALLMYLVLWLVPLLTVLQPILRLRAICEHGAVIDLSSPLTAARSNNTSGNWLNWLARAVLFPHHVNYHLEHHLYPAVPHYNLPKLHALLAAKGALQGAQVRDVASTFALIFAPRLPKPRPAAGAVAAAQPATPNRQETA
jgi:fatty acid desaturase